MHDPKKLSVFSPVIAFALRPPQGFPLMIYHESNIPKILIQILEHPLPWVAGTQSALV